MNQPKEIPLFEKAGEIAEDILKVNVMEVGTTKFSLRTMLADAVVRGFNFAVETFDTYEEDIPLSAEVLPVLTAPQTLVNVLSKLPANNPMKRKSKGKRGFVQPLVRGLLARHVDGLSFVEMRKLAPGMRPKAISNAVYRMNKTKQVEKRDGKWFLANRKK